LFRHGQATNVATRAFYLLSAASVIVANRSARARSGTLRDLLEIASTTRRAMIGKRRERATIARLTIVSKKNPESRGKGIPRAGEGGGGGGRKDRARARDYAAESANEGTWTGVLIANMTVLNSPRFPSLPRATLELVLPSNYASII